MDFTSKRGILNILMLRMQTPQPSSSLFDNQERELQTSVVAQLVKNLPALQETPVPFLGQEDPLEKGWATQSRILGLPWWLRR